MTRVVSIVQRRLTHYRVPLFERMRLNLLAQGVTLRLLHGEPMASERSKNDEGHLPWAQPLSTRYWLDGRICWQPFMGHAADSDLLIITQENKLVNNLLELVVPRRKGQLAFWGHGRNLQARRPNGVSEQFKGWTTRRVDWWFAYTDLSASLVRNDRFPPDCITVLNNSIDTVDLRLALAHARRTPVALLRANLGLAASGPLAVFLGSLYSDKRIAWLIQAADAIQARVPGFQLAIAGEGPDRPLVDMAAARSAHVHALGAVRGERKASLLAAADLMLNPGLVGLGILDAFVAGLPMLTTNCGLHSPEIAYLQPGENGLTTEDNLDTYVHAVVQLLQNPPMVDHLRRGAMQSGEAYSIEHMADRFCSGIMNCLEHGKPRSHMA